MTLTLVLVILLILAVIGIIYLLTEIHTMENINKIADKYDVSPFLVNDVIKEYSTPTEVEDVLKDYTENFRNKTTMRKIGF